MKLFTELVKESQREYTECGLEDLEKFMDIVKKSKAVSKDYLKILQNLYVLGVMDGKTIDERIINGGSGDLKWMVQNYGGPIDMYIETNKLAKKCKSELKGLPWFMSEAEFNAVMDGTKVIDDIVLDLETEKGREQCAKLYAPLVAAIARKYQGSGLDYNQLVSSGYMGLTKAMNDYHRPEEYVDVETGLDNDQKKEVKKAKGQTFRQYAGWRIRFQILNDLNDLSRTVKIGQYQYEKNKAMGNTRGNFNTISIDRSIDDEGSTMVDRMEDLANDSDAFADDRSANKKWEQVYKLIDDRFSARTASMFYKTFGLHGYKKMKQVEIAKELGVSGAVISMRCKEILKFLKSNKKTMSILQDLLDIYSESLICSNTPETIMEAMIQDDLFIMLQESTQWMNARVFNNAVGQALENLQTEARSNIIMCLEGDLNYIDDNYDKFRKDIILFLESIYPTECIRRKSDVEIISMMNELSENHHEHNLND